jgi:hypothetical protein
MYKLTSGNTVLDLSYGDGKSRFVPVDHPEYKQWLSEGGIPEPEFTDVELLANAKATKKQELETAFQVASMLPVTVGTKSYNGGKESAQAIRDSIDVIVGNGGTAFTIWDFANDLADYTLAQANTIMLTIGAKALADELNLRKKKNAVNDATTITAVNAVTL